jgi:hypothetical protein
MNLPPLPEPCHGFYGTQTYSPELMRAYAAAAVLAERERLMAYYDAQCAVELVRLRDSIPAKIEAAVLAERERCSKLALTTRETGNRFPVTASEQLRMDIAAAIREAPREGADCHPPKRMEYGIGCGGDPLDDDYVDEHNRRHGFTTKGAK